MKKKLKSAKYLKGIYFQAFGRLCFIYINVVIVSEQTSLIGMAGANFDWHYITD